MNGSEHYAEAERLLHRIGHCTSDSPEDKALLANLAEVHATLALAAATALADVEFVSRTDRSDWMRATTSARASGTASAVSS